MVHSRRKIRRRQHGTLLMFLITVLALFAVWSVWKGAVWFCNYRGKNTAYDTLILEASRRNGIDPRLVKAVVWRESRFSPGVVGKAGEIGLMQVMPDRAAVDWAKAHDRPVPLKGALFHPALNIEIGSWYLARAVRRWQRYQDCYVLALSEYNAGLARANRWKPADPSEEVRPRISISSTLSYVNAILDKYEEYKKDWKIQ